MYNNLVKKLLLNVQVNDSKTFKQQQKYISEDSFSKVEMYICKDNVSFKVLGDGYLIAMVKWLQLKLKNGENIRDISLDNLVDKFDLPEAKYRNALQIFELIERINEGSSI